MKKLLLVLFIFLSVNSYCQINIDSTIYKVVKNITSFGQFSLDSAISHFTNKWLYVPYHYGGDSINGIDCSHLNLEFLKEVFYITTIGSCREQWHQFKKISKGKIEPGDLVFFRSKQSPSGWHCGTYIGDGEFIHASNKKDGVKISKLDLGIYKKNYRGAVRVR